MDMYGEMILDHSKRPVRAGLREGYAAQVHHINPTCGDEVTLRVHLSPVERDVVAPSGHLSAQLSPNSPVEHEVAPSSTQLSAVLSDVSYDALGCSISVASTSILAEECIGETIEATLARYRSVHAMLTSRGTDAGDAEEIGDAVALAGVAKYPARVKCALLGWTAYLDALAQSGVDISSRETL
ncbi:MAG: iron-sulfur cluster assembly scaffold protein [Ornithinimicrobium sp.]